MVNHNDNELFTWNKIGKRVSLCFHHSYNSRFFGVNYGKRYHYDPIYRIESELKVAAGLYRKFGKYGMGQAEPLPTLGVGIQPLDFLNAALGGKMVFRKDEAVQTPEKPLSNIRKISELEKLGDILWQDHPLFEDLFKQVEQMKKAYPELPISYIQGVWRDGPAGQKTFLTMHTPYTTAFRILGQEILELMLLDQEFVNAVLEWILCQYQSLWQAICGRMGWRGTKLHFGDCAATMLSPNLYKCICLPLYQKLMEDFEAAVIHSCGTSTHLLELFAQIPKVRQLQLGADTDWRLARKFFPRTQICAYYGCAKLLSQGPLDIERQLWRMCEQLEDNFDVNCGGVDPDTPEENIYAYLETARKINETGK